MLFFLLKAKYQKKSPNQVEVIKFLQKIKMSFLLFLETVQFVIHRVAGIKHKVMKARISNFIPIHNGSN